MPPYHNLVVYNKTHMELLAPFVNCKLSTGFEPPLSKAYIVRVSI